MTTTRIPCKRPRVRVNELLGRDRVAAVCDVPGCGWHYDNVAITDVREQAVRHRRAHRDAVPKTWIERDAEYDVYCAPCGGHRRTFATRAHAKHWLRHHLTAKHGLVECP